MSTIFHILAKCHLPSMGSMRHEGESMTTLAHMCATRNLASWLSAIRKCQALWAYSPMENVVFKEHFTMLYTALDRFCGHVITFNSPILNAYVADTIRPAMKDEARRVDEAPAAAIHALAVLVIRLVSNVHHVEKRFGGLLAGTALV
jgi:hypothetical protein